MAEQARVKIEDLLAFRASLVKLRDGLRLALMSADTDVARTADWLKREQPAHWVSVGKKLTRRVEDAKETLRRKMLSPTPTGEKPSTMFEQKMLRTEKQKLEVCKEKAQLTKKWERRFEKVAFDYRGQTQGLRQIVESALPKAIGHIDQLVAHLQRYQDATISLDTLNEAIGDDLVAAGMARATTDFNSDLGSETSSDSSQTSTTSMESNADTGVQANTEINADSNAELK